MSINFKQLFGNSLPIGYSIYFKFNFLFTLPKYCYLYYYANENTRLKGHEALSLCLKLVIARKIFTRTVNENN